MNIKQLFIALVIISICSYLFFTKKSDVKKDDRILVVGTSADYQPYAFVDTKTNEIVGFDIDVVTEIAKRLDKKMILKDIPFASLVFGILSGDIDIVAAGMSPTAKRAETVLFSQPYIEPDPFMIITKQSDAEIKNIQDLVGKKVAVNTGYTAEAYLADQDGIDLIRLTNPAESMMSLKSGAIDAFVCARSVANLILNQNNSSEYSAVVIPDTGDGCAMAMNKNNHELVAQVNLILDAMQQDGTLDQLKQKWNLK